MIGLIIIAPYAWVTIRRISRDREAPDPASAPPSNGQSAEPYAPDPLEVALQELQEFAHRASVDGAHHEISLTTPAISRGTELSSRLVAQLLGDTARQLGLRCEMAVDAGGLLRVAITKSAE